MIPTILKIVKKLDLRYIDLKRLFYEKNHLFGDDVHPNEEGANLISDVVYDHLKNKVKSLRDVEYKSDFYHFRHENYKEVVNKHFP